ncbi:MAG TPA: AGE family epimerase/isomerase [Phnomibacter sp.]|nr:AGE family epimerase/isomerase [Phnomibacter sp.]
MSFPHLQVEQAEIMKSYAMQYKDELLHHVVPFWETHSVDKEYGGFFTCLRRDGSVYDTDKFMWLQGRQVWTFSMLYDKVEPRESWKKMAIHGADFMKKYGRDAAGNWYFSLTREGKPLVQPYNIFSDCFAAMGFGALYKITGNEEYKQIAQNTFYNILRRQHNWKGVYNKAYPGTRPLRNFSLPMILCNLGLELEHILGHSQLETLAKEVMHDVLEVFYQPDLGHVMENVAPDGSFVDCFEGRLLNPGHTIEAMWFIIDLAKRFNRPELVEKATRIMLSTLEHGWDEAYGGIFYFLDVKGNPPQQLEWDQKLWWVHIETLVGLAKAWKATGDERCLAWFEKVHAYTWNHFKDEEYKEWFGYLNRQGDVLLDLKGGKWKGCFHIPRGLYQLWKTLE